MTGTLFAYGSLCDPAAASATLGRDVVPRPARAHGWERGWFVAIDNHASASYACGRCDGLPPACLVLGVRPAPGGRVLGALIDLAAGDVQRVAARERSYSLEHVVTRTPSGDDVPALMAVPLPQNVAPPGTSIAIAGAYEHAAMQALAALCDVTGDDPLAQVLPSPAPRRDDLAYVRDDGHVRAHCTCPAP